MVTPILEINGVRTVPTARGPIQEETFYTQRDSRTSIVHAAPPPRQRVAIMLARPGMATVDELLLVRWSASLLRRMGRGFSHSIILASDEFLDSEIRGVPVREQLLSELQSADPFGTTEFRKPEPTALDDVQFLIAIGPQTWSTDTPTLNIAVHGWVIFLSSKRGDPPLPPVAGNAATLMVAASLAVASAYSRCVLRSRDELRSLGFALDAGGVTTDPDEASSWLARGSAQSTNLPWMVKGPDMVTLPRLVLVSAGGLGMNVATLLAHSPLIIDNLYVIDPDRVDVSNLNRLLNVGIQHLTDWKAVVAATAFQESNVAVSSIIQTYEAWRSVTEPVQPPNEEVLMLGVDQVATRLEAAADWPRVLINGATAGLSCVSSVHRPGENGCLGCYYGRARVSYAAMNQPLACAGGPNGSPVVPQAVAASYPFVSTAGAALMVANLLYAVYAHRAGGSTIEMNVTRPELCAMKILQPVTTCRLLCGDPALQPFFSDYRQ